MPANRMNRQAADWDILPVGLRLLAALAQLCRSDSASLLQRAA